MLRARRDCYLSGLAFWRGGFQISLRGNCVRCGSVERTASEGGPYTKPPGAHEGFSFGLVYSRCIDLAVWEAP